MGDDRFDWMEATVTKESYLWIPSDVPIFLDLRLRFGRI